MWIGVGRLTLDFYNNESLSEKKRQLEALSKDLRKTFNLSILEVAEFDDPEECVIGFAAVLPETWRHSAAQSFVQKICQTIDNTAFARVTSEDWDVLSHGGEK